MDSERTAPPADAAAPRLPPQEKSVEMGTSGPHQGDFLPPELMHLLGTARHVIDQHVNDQGHCAECGSIWPCQRAQLAELALGSL